MNLAARAIWRSRPSRYLSTDQRSLLNCFLLLAPADGLPVPLALRDLLPSAEALVGIDGSQVPTLLKALEGKGFLRTDADIAADGRQMFQLTFAGRRELGF